MIAELNESTAGADASIGGGTEAIPHEAITLAYSSLLALLAIVACQSGSLHCTKNEK